MRSSRAENRNHQTPARYHKFSKWRCCSHMHSIYHSFWDVDKILNWWDSRIESTHENQRFWVRRNSILRRGLIAMIGSSSLEVMDNLVSRRTVDELAERKHLREED